jgi:hypothetical protein
MNIETVLVLAANLCCEISVNSKGEIELEGDPTNLDKLAPVVRENKTALLYHLTRARRHGLDPGRTWAPALSGAITTEADHITRVKTAPGVCPLCGVPFDQDGGDCWHRAFHIGAEESTGAPPSDDKPTPAPTACENQDGQSCGHQMGMRISPVALSWLCENRRVLQCNGWTMAELYRRNKSRGIAWVGLWDHPGLSVAIESGGVISFNFLTATGQRIRQTAWPKNHHPKRSPKI